MNWTPCTEGFPEDNEPCLITIFGKDDGGKLVNAAMRRNGKWIPEYDEDGHYEITAWIKFPEPY